MRRLRAAALAVFVSAIACAACSGEDRRPRAGAAGLTAQGVSLEVPAGDRTVRARAERLQMVDGEDEIVLLGAALVELDGPSRIEARADRLRLVADGPVIEMTGSVRAIFDLPTGAAVSGADDAGL